MDDFSFRYSISVVQVLDDGFSLPTINENETQSWPITQATTALKYISVSQFSFFSVSPSYDPTLFLSLIIYILLCWTLEKLIILMKSFWNKDEISFLNLVSVFWFILFSHLVRFTKSTISSGTRVYQWFRIQSIQITNGLSSNFKLEPSLTYSPVCFIIRTESNMQA